MTDNQTETIKNNYKLYIDNNLISNSKIGALSWSNNIEGLSGVLNFPSLETISLGAKFLLINNDKEIIRGIITDESSSKSKIKQYTGFDYGFHINKNEVTRQFNGASGDDAIKQLLSSIGVPYGTIETIPVKIKEIYQKQTVASIIKDILKQAKDKLGIEYLLKIKYGKVYVEKFKEIDISNLEYYLSDSEKRKIIDTIGEFSSNRSIQELKNRVLIVKDDGNKGASILADVKDEESIKKYGLLQTIESYDKESKQSSQVIANNLLKEKNKTTETLNLDMLGIDEAQSGTILSFNTKEHGIIGKFLIQNDTHTVISNNNHKMNVDLKFYGTIEK